MSLLTIFVCSTCQGAIAIEKISLTDTVYMLIHTADKGRTAPVQLAAEEAETWQDMSSWALTINVCPGYLDHTVGIQSMCVYTAPAE